MEKSYFSQDEFAEVLNKNYIEARLHTDMAKTPETQMKRIREKQREFVGHKSMPVYVIVDPETGKVVDKLEGFTADSKVILEFLQKNLGN